MTTKATERQPFCLKQKETDRELIQQLRLSCPQGKVYTEGNTKDLASPHQHLASQGAAYGSNLHPTSPPTVAPGYLPKVREMLLSRQAVVADPNSLFSSNIHGKFVCRSWVEYHPRRPRWCRASNEPRSAARRVEARHERGRPAKARGAASANHGDWKQKKIRRLYLRLAAAHTTHSCSLPQHPRKPTQA